MYLSKDAVKQLAKSLHADIKDSTSLSLTQVQHLIAKGLDFNAFNAIAATEPRFFTRPGGAVSGLDAMLDALDPRQTDAFIRLVKENLLPAKSSPVTFTERSHGVIQNAEDVHLFFNYQSTLPSLNLCPSAFQIVMEYNDMQYFVEAVRALPEGTQHRLLVNLIPVTKALTSAYQHARGTLVDLEQFTGRDALQWSEIVFQLPKANGHFERLPCQGGVQFFSWNSPLHAQLSTLPSVIALRNLHQCAALGEKHATWNDLATEIRLLSEAAQEIPVTLHLDLYDPSEPFQAKTEQVCFVEAAELFEGQPMLSAYPVSWTETVDWNERALEEDNVVPSEKVTWKQLAEAIDGLPPRLRQEPVALYLENDDEEFASPVMFAQAENRLTMDVAVSFRFLMP